MSEKFNNFGKLMPWLIPAYMLALVVGPSLYFYMSLVRGDLLLTAPVLLFFLWYGMQDARPGAYYAGLYLLLSLLAVMALHTLFNRNQLQILDFVYNLNLVSLYISAYFIAAHRPFILVLLQSYSLAILACLVVLVLQFTVDFKLMHKSGEGGSEFPAAFFSNPNNLATFLVVSIPLLHWCSKETGKPWLFRVNIIMITLVLLAMMSRTALVLLAIYPLLYSLLFSRNPVHLLLPTVLVVFAIIFINSPVFEQLLLGLMQVETEFIGRSAERLWLALYDLGDDKSVGYRSEIYAYAFPRLFTIFQGFGSREYGEFFAGNVSGPLAYINPHSFLIEITLAYSTAALLLFLSLLALMGLQSVKNWGMASRFWLIAAAFFLLGGFIPSTILRMQLVWLPMFVLFFAVLNKNKEHPECIV